MKRGSLICVQVCDQVGHSNVGPPSFVNKDRVMISTNDNDVN